MAKALFLDSSSGSTPGGPSKRKLQAELEEKVNALYTNIKLFEKSLRVITGKFQVVLRAKGTLVCAFANDSL